MADLEEDFVLTAEKAYGNSCDENMKTPLDGPSLLEIAQMRDQRLAAGVTSTRVLGGAAPARQRLPTGHTAASAVSRLVSTSQKSGGNR